MRCTNYNPIKLVGISILLLSLGNCGTGHHDKPLPDGFVYLDHEFSLATSEPRYCSDNNFTGKPVPGYDTCRIILALEAAEALRKAAVDLEFQGYGVKVFDAYRPQKSVDHFVAWSKVADDTSQKQVYYPNVKKEELFPGGYIAAKSGHSRGSAIDLTLVDLSTGKEVDMGTPFDYFGEASHPSSELVSDSARANRKILQDAMIHAGFEPIETEWWHFYLKEEPYPETYFDFNIK